MPVNNGRSENAFSEAGDFDVQLFLGDVDDVIDNQTHDAIALGDHKQSLLAIAAHTGAADGDERHQLAAILQNLAAIGNFNVERPDALNARDEFQRQRFRLPRARAENQHRCLVIDGLIVIFRDFVVAHADEIAECARDAVRVHDQNDGAIAQDRRAGEHRDMAQPARQRLHHDLFGIEHAIDHHAE